MNKLHLVLIVLLSLQTTFIAQNSKIDSLQIVLKNVKNDTVKIQTLNAISIAFKNIGELEKTMEYANKGVSFAQSAFAKNKSTTVQKALQKYLANSLFILGWLHDTKHDYTKAIDYYTQSLKISQTINNKNGIYKAHNALGQVYRETPDYSKALEHLFISLKTAQELNDTGKIATSYNEIGSIHYLRSDYSNALENYFKSLQYRSGFNDGIAFTCNNIGNVYADLKNENKALEYYIKALNVWDSLGKQNMVAMANSNIGSIYFDQKNIPLALEYFFKAFKIREKGNNKKQLSSNQSNIAMSYLGFYEDDTLQKGLKFKLNQKNIFIPYSQLIDSALAWYNKSLAINLWLNDAYSLATTYDGIGRILVLQKQYQKALSHFQKSYFYSDSIGALQHKMQSASLIYSLYKKLNDAPNALAWHEKYISCKDSIYNAEANKKTAQAEIKYEYEKKAAIEKVEQEKKEAIHKEEINRQTMQRNAFIAGFALMLILASVIFRSFRNKKRANEIIAQQKHEVEHQKELVEHKQKEIIDSISYAKRLQDAILPPIRLIESLMPQSFVLYKPKDIVAGDFYWIETVDDVILFAAADCTGHGVPGAMVSVVCSNALNRAVKEFNITDPGKILDKVRELVIETFEKSESEVKDGMDISLCSLNTKTNELKWAGANNPVWIILNNSKEFIEIKANKQPIGKYVGQTPFTTHSLILQPEDTIYIFTDGYADQFGGPKGKKYKYKQLQEKLVASTQLTLPEQKDFLLNDFMQWKGNLEQIDDVCVIGVKVQYARA